MTVSDLARRPPAADRRAPRVDPGALADRAARPPRRRTASRSPRPRSRATSSTSAPSGCGSARTSCTPCRARAATAAVRAAPDGEERVDPAAVALPRAAGLGRALGQPGHPAHPAGGRELPRLGPRPRRPRGGARHHRRRRHHHGRDRRRANAAAEVVDRLLSYTRRDLRVTDPNRPTEQHGPPCGVGGSPAARPTRSPPCRKSTHFDWRLALHDLAGSRAHARVLHAAGLLDDADPGRDARRAGAAARRRRVRCVHARTRTTRTCTPRSSAGSSTGPAPTSAAGCAPAARATTRSPPCSGCTCASTRGSSPAWCSTSSTRWSTRPTRHLGVAMPGRTHLQHAQPVLLSHHLLAHAWALLRDVDRLRDWDVRAAVSPYGSGALAGSSLGLDPRGRRRRPRLRRARSRTRSTAPPAATSSPSSRSSPR